MKKVKTKKLKDQIVEAKKTDPTLQQAFEGAMTLAEWGFKCEQTLNQCNETATRIFSYRFDLEQALSKIEDMKTEINCNNNNVKFCESQIFNLSNRLEKLEKKKWYQFWR